MRLPPLTRTIVSRSLHCGGFFLYKKDKLIASLPFQNDCQFVVLRSMTLPLKLMGPTTCAVVLAVAFSTVKV